MRRLVGAVLVVGLLLAGCADDEPDTPPVPVSVAGLDPCALIGADLRTDLWPPTSNRGCR